ncbi:MAG: nucleoside triphosphate pyrophosphohydrolase family protein [Candidatus Paceibacterota bacterium]
MEFGKYQKESRKTRVDFNMRDLPYLVLALNGEAGEIAEKVKKVYRDDEGEVTKEKRKDIEKEIGDCLWYLTQIATELGLSLDEIACTNLNKLKDRKDRGTLHGEGDNR